MKKYKFLIFLVVFILLIALIQIRAKYYEKKLLTKGKFTIMRIDSFNVIPKFTNIYSSFYCKKKKIINIESKSESNISEKDIEKFYEIKYLNDTPDVSMAHFNKQITDTIAILEAGFTKADIEFKK